KTAALPSGCRRLSVDEQPNPTATTPAAAPDGPVEPDLLTHAGRYRLEGEIARGGMGAICRAHDPDLGRTLAVKVLLAHHRGDPPPGPAASWGRRRSAASCSPPASRPSTSWARCPTAGPSSP